MQHKFPLREIVLLPVACAWHWRVTYSEAMKHQNFRSLFFFIVVFATPKSTKKKKLRISVHGVFVLELIFESFFFGRQHDFSACTLVSLVIFIIILLSLVFSFVFDSVTFLSYVYFAITTTTKKNAI